MDSDGPGSPAALRTGTERGMERGDGEGGWRGGVID